MNEPDQAQRPCFRTSAFYLILCAGCVGLLSWAFTYISGYWEFPFLDTLIAPLDVKTALDAMTDGQKEVHIWAIWLLDMAYPLFFWGMFGGLIRRGLSRWSDKLIWAPRLMFLSDLAENIVETSLLLGAEGWLELKFALTSAKFMLVVVSGLLAFTALLSMMRKRLHPN